MFLQKIRKIKEHEVGFLGRPGVDREKPILNPLKALNDAPIIAEVKRASPTKLKISDRDPFDVALLYERAGAGVISVLADKIFFNGGWDVLKGVCDRVAVPVLCKEFIISPVQLDMAYVLGADVVLLIAALLTDEELAALYDYAKRLGLFVLVEIHSPEEYERVKWLSPDMIGVNSRDLNTLEIDLLKAASVIKSLPHGLFKVAESGIKGEEELRIFAESGADAFLIGEALMRAENPERLIKRFTHVCKSVRHNLC